MNTQCTPAQLEFHAFGRREVVARFDAGRLTSDGGGILLREVDRQLGLMAGIARCFADHRDPRKVEHSATELVAQRVYGIALGYEDLNDHDALRGDSLLALLVGKADPTGEKRPRERDRGCPMAGSSTLNRLELGGPDANHGCPKEMPSGWCPLGMIGMGVLAGWLGWVSSGDGCPDALALHGGVFWAGVWYRCPLTRFGCTRKRGRRRLWPRQS